MFEVCPDKIPSYLTNPEITRVVREGGEYIKKEYSDGVTVWINQLDGERKTYFPKINGHHYDNPETKEIHFLEKTDSKP